MLIKRNKHVLPVGFCSLLKKNNKARMSEQALCIIKILEYIEGKRHTVRCLINNILRFVVREL